MNKILVASIIALLLALNVHAQNIYDIESSKRFARFLFNSEEFTLAATEYERVVFLDSTDIEARYLLLKSYRKAKQFNKGLKRAESLNIDLAFSSAAVQKEYSFLLIKTGNFMKAQSFLNQPTSLASADKDFLSLSLMLMYGDYKGAGEFANNANLSNTYDMQGLKRLAGEAAALNFKSPGLGLAMSAFVPGLGKVYANAWKDGLLTFLFVGSAVFQAYRGFNKHGTNSGYGWVYAGLGTGFYLGNLYGSYKAVNKYNHNLKHDIYHRTEEVFDNMD